MYYYYYLYQTDSNLYFDDLKNGKYNNNNKHMNKIVNIWFICAYAHHTAFLSTFFSSLYSFFHSIFIEISVLHNTHVERATHALSSNTIAVYIYFYCSPINENVRPHSISIKIYSNFWRIQFYCHRDEKNE